MLNNEQKSPEEARAGVLYELKQLGANLPGDFEKRLAQLDEAGAAIGGDLPNGGTWEVIRGETEKDLTIKTGTEEPGEQAAA